MLSENPRSTTHLMAEDMNHVQHLHHQAGHSEKGKRLCRATLPFENLTYRPSEPLADINFNAGGFTLGLQDLGRAYWEGDHHHQAAEKRVPVPGVEPRGPQYFGGRTPGLRDLLRGHSEAEGIEVAAQPVGEGGYSQAPTAWGGWWYGVLCCAAPL